MEISFSIYDKYFLFWEEKNKHFFIFDIKILLVMSLEKPLLMNEIHQAELFVTLLVTLITSSTKISADFSTVCASPNVYSKFSPEQKIP